MEKPMKLDDLGVPLFKTLIFCFFFFNDTVDNCEILYQLKTVVYPIIFRVSTI